MPQTKPTIETRIATPADLTAEDLAIFSTELTKTNYETPDIRFQEARMKLREWLERCKIMSRITRPTPPDCSPKLDIIHPTPTFATIAEYQTDHFKKKIADGSTTLLTVDGKTAGIGHIRTEGKTDDGRTVYALGGLVLKPEYRGKGYSKALTKSRLAELKEKHPDNPIIVQSRNPKVINYYAKLGWKEITIREKAKFRQNESGKPISEKDIREREESDLKYGWKIFLFDPLEDKKDQTI